MTTRTFRPWRQYATVALSCCTAVLAATALASGAAPARHGASAAVSTCTAANTKVWFALGTGGGTAGTYYSPLEFSNIGHRTCTLYGYPGVSAFRGALRQVGPTATRAVQSHVMVALAPGATAPAILGVHDWGAICTKPAAADGLLVYPPGQTVAQSIDMAMQVCAHRAVLTVGALHAGVGIPGYTAP